MCRPTRIKDNHVTARKRAPLLSYFFHVVCGIMSVKGSTIIVSKNTAPHMQNHGPAEQNSIEGQLLFALDPRPLQAVLDQAKGQLAQANAQELQAEANQGAPRA